MITLCFVGDYCLAGYTPDKANQQSPTCAKCQAAVESADLAIANLESCLVDEDSSCGRFMAGPESRCKPVAGSGFDVFTLANNHIMDCDEQGLEFTRRYLDTNGIATVGTADTSAEVNVPLIMNCDDKRIAIFAVTDASHYKARRNKAGVAPLQPNRLRKAVRGVRADVDLVIVCVHSDLEFTNYPAPWKVRLSKRLVEDGANLVVHHHPHTLQGIETYNGSLIAYSLGNFVFPVHGRKYMANKDGNVDESIILLADLHFADDGRASVAHRLLPVVIGKDNLTKVAEGARAESIVKKMSGYSEALGDVEYLRRHHFDMCRKEVRRFTRGTYYAVRKGGIKEAFDYLRVHFFTSMHRNWMRGFLTFGYF